MKKSKFKVGQFVKLTWGNGEFTLRITKKETNGWWNADGMLFHESNKEVKILKQLNSPEKNEI